MGLEFPRAFSKSENLLDSLLALDLMLVIRALAVLLRPNIDSSWTALLSANRSSGFPLVFRELLA